MESEAESVFVDWLARRASGSVIEVEALCGGRADLLARVRELQSEHDALQNVRGAVLPREAGTGGPDTSRSAATATTVPWRMAQTGEMLRRMAANSAGGSRYRDIHKIASGGMSHVFRVTDSDLDRELALKRMRDEFADEDLETFEHLLHRFVQEAQITAKLGHPGVVPIHEIGVDAEGRVFFTMPIVAGQHLGDMIREAHAGTGPLPFARFVSLLVRICETMSYAHSRGVIHRDLKPANVMVGSFGEVFVMDWGLARIEDGPIPGSPSIRTIRRSETSGSTDSPLATSPNRQPGTPAYMAPEQAAGKEVTAASDIHAVGAILYEFLTGRVPFVAPGERVGADTIRERVRAGALAPVESVMPSTPPELIAICSRAMAREPRDRYPSMTAFGDDLRAFLESRVIQAYEHGPWAELRRWVGRNRGTAGALAGLLLAILLGGLLTASLRSEVLGRELLLTQIKAVPVTIGEVQRLWPAVPVTVPTMDRWLEESERLLARRVEIDAVLEAMARGGSTEVPRDEVRRSLEDLRSAREQVLKRREFALEVGRQSTGSEAAQTAWREAVEQVRRSVSYAGLTLRPQEGLLPLGIDPATRLQEFAHLPSGAACRRGAGGRLIIDDTTGIVLVLLPGGSATMGSQATDPAGPHFDPDAGTPESPVERVELAPFFVSKFEVTQAQWQRMTGRNPSAYRPGRSDEILPPDSVLLRPVESVLWASCRAMAENWGLALPTEAQWEYAARAGTPTRWWCGDRFEDLQGNSNLCDASVLRAGLTAWPQIDERLDDGHFGPAPVDAFGANPFGLHGVIGNVQEWCLEDRQSYALTEARAGDGLREGPEATGQRLARGGAFNSSNFQARSAMRDARSEESALTTVGFRPVRRVDP